jgi:hypothetical protein
MFEPAEQTPRKRSSISRILFQEESISDVCVRSPLTQMDGNGINCRLIGKSGNHSIYKQ